MWLRGLINLSNTMQLVSGSPIQARADDLKRHILLIDSGISFFPSALHQPVPDPQRKLHQQRQSPRTTSRLDLHLSRKWMQELCLCKGLALVSYWLLLGLAKHLHLHNCEWGLQQQHRASAATFTVFFMAAQATAFDTCPFPK